MKSVPGTKKKLGTADLDHDYLSYSCGSLCLVFVFLGELFKKKCSPHTHKSYAACWNEDADPYSFSAAQYVLCDTR